MIVNTTPVLTCTWAPVVNVSLLIVVLVATTGGFGASPVTTTAEVTPGINPHCQLALFVQTLLTSPNHKAVAGGKLFEGVTNDAEVVHVGW